MSQLVPRPDGRPALRPKLTREQIVEYVAKPLRMLPAEWRVPVWAFWSSWSHILQDQLALASRLRRWHQEDGLTLDEAQSVFDRLGAPDTMARIQFPGQLHAELATLVAELVGRRKRIADMVHARMAEQQAVVDRYAATGIGAEWQKMLANVGKIPEEHATNSKLD